ncbi:uncharacterized protein KGF55_000303 [Candida pseudojiufengensis]|uniref:uncharacterized protein n=1 Tax=Candida pseudojiufengensis TaxID=497109 RepID=UPI002225AC2A|nr:uncharacterized protein KGF55_000303 [Candida pseudojiufengensis]KAI5966894.1 hypothetical protein KGF55_000303 [Candida pseudojiufengensis]
MKLISYFAYQLNFIILACASPFIKCSFPDDLNLIKVAANGANAGWAMSPDQICVPGMHCLYACPPGQLMNQWDASVSTYSFPSSLNGGLKCETDGSLTKPFKDKSLCVDGKGTVSVINKVGKDVAFCQTVLPGNEAMLIPTNCGRNEQELAVPGPEYYAGTSAHYYVNFPGIATKDACVWGSKDNALGNWAPYIAGMNMDQSGNTFVTIGFNPNYLDQFPNKKIDFGLKITCDNPEDCVGLGCEINPESGQIRVERSFNTNLNSAAFCVVTAKNHAKAKIEVFKV